MDQKFKLQSTLILVSLLYYNVVGDRSFIIDYDGNRFLKDGVSFRYISGSMHYSRVTSAYWRDRLEKMYAAGLNAVQTYVPWNYHEDQPGIYDFQGERDLPMFIRIAQEVGLLVILRAGPYMCGEWEMGGFPAWLLRDSSIKLRTSDKTYLSYVDKWLGILLPKMKPLLYENGGPIITVQVENEYGSYPACDAAYMTHLRDKFRDYLGPNVVLFTTDGASDGFLKCGHTQGLYATVDFGPGGNPMDHFKAQRDYEPKGPLVNSEYYTGWLDHWGGHHSTTSSSTAADSLDAILKVNASVNMYMFEGGTSFGFMNGANGGGSSYQPQPTSYDYDAPLSEAGDPTEKYFAIRKVISKYAALPSIPVPPATHKMAYGKVQMTASAWLLDANGLVVNGSDSDYPLNMEALHQNYGFVVYTLMQPLQIPSSGTTNYTLTILTLHDRAVVYVDDVVQGIVSRMDLGGHDAVVQITVPSTSKGYLHIVVENQGRINYGGDIDDRKGILGNVTLNGVILSGWKSWSYPLKDLSSIAFNKLSANSVHTSTAFFRAQLPFFKEGQKANDTYLLLNGWTKGQAFINGHNLGRYWPVKGPQKTLYVPYTVFNTTDPSSNEIIVFEIDKAPCIPPFDECYVTFVDTPDIG